MEQEEMRMNMQICCHDCQKLLVPDEIEEGYATVWRCSECGAMNYYPMLKVAK